MPDNDPLLAVPVARPQTKHMTAQRQFQGIPGIEVSPKGRIWVAWYSGGVNEGPENFVVLAKSDDRGASWSEPLAVIDPPGENIRAFDETLWIDPLGRLWLFWAQSFSSREHVASDGLNGVWGAYLEDPDTQDFKWSQSIRICDGIMLNKPTVLRDGTWAMPVAIWGDGVGGGKLPEQLREFDGAGLVASADNGKSFSWRGAFIPDARIFDEHMFVELRDGRLWGLARTLYGIGQSFSSDGGLNWSKCENSGLHGPNSRFFVRRLRSGRLLMVNHQSKSEETQNWRTREKLTAYLSDDDGNSWSGGLMLDERQGVSYPDGAQEIDGRIWIIYDHQRYKEGDILAATFTEEEILAGKLISVDSRLKILVNHSGGIQERKL
ncbi:MAG: hypothetical protein A2X49_06585 [Lentisphaerae bacterium GWF2_52_8]|nr:MAG: hypothetical protein A2X49_06585 [Lentisphaerae bacterium GWF2_52_8]